jgi:hypothetical protein
MREALWNVITNIRLMVVIVVVSQVIALARVLA